MNVRHLVITSPNATLMCQRLRANLDPAQQGQWQLTACPIHVIKMDLSPFDQAQLTAQIQALDWFDGVVFMSPNAVHALARQMQQWPTGVAMACTGPATHQVWREYFGPAPANLQIVAPADSSAEDLLTQMQAAAQKNPRLLNRVLIMRAQSGREFLPESLRALGAQVHCCTTYYRQVSLIALNAASDFAKKPSANKTIYYFSSSETFQVWQQHLTASMPDLDFLKSRLILWVSHPRIADTARAFAWPHIIHVRHLNEWLKTS